MSDEVTKRLANIHPYCELWQTNGHVCFFCHRQNYEPHKESCLWLYNYRLHTGENDYTGDWIYMLDNDEELTND